MKPSELLSQYKSEIIKMIQRYPVSNPRVFGSVAYGTDQEGSDLDFLVDPMNNTNLFHLGGLQDELEQLLGIPIDLVTPLDKPSSYRDDVLRAAQPL